MTPPRRILAVLAACVSLAVCASWTAARPFADKKHPAEEAGLKSYDTQIDSTISFVNKGKKPVKVYWINYEGERMHYKTLDAGESYDQPTFLTHPWLIADEAGDARSIYYPDGQPRTVEIVDPAEK
jgi:von Hippel-Lindau disease tumor supressor